MATPEGPVMKKIGILVTGKVGSGKSSLVNGILGLKIEDEGKGAAEKTNTVQPETYTTGRFTNTTGRFTNIHHW